jgi:tetratricopeptide (TPR) repeat protein
MISCRFAEAYQIIESWSDDKKLDGLILKGNLLNCQGELEQALDTIDDALDFARDCDDELSTFNALTVKCSVLMKLGKTEEIKYVFKEGKKILKHLDSKPKINASWGTSSFYNVQGIFHLLNGNAEQSIQDLLRSMEIYTNINDKFGIASTTQNIGFYYKTIGNFEKAYEYYYRSIEYYNELEYQYGKATVLSNIGDLLSSQGKVDEAKNYLNNALYMYSQVIGNPDPHLLAYCYRRLGRIYLSLGKFENSQNYFYLALEAIKGIEHPLNLAEISFDLILQMIEENKIEKTVKWITVLQNLNETHPDNRVISIISDYIKGLMSLQNAKRLDQLANAEKIFRSIR